MDKSSIASVNVDENSFDYMRIICAVTIFLGHFLTHFNYESIPLNFIAYFVRGVPVFFCLSGFFCARSLERYSKTEFLKKRIIRIYPALWVCLIINTVIIAITYAVKPSIKEAIIYFFTQFTVFQFYTGDWLRGYGVGAPNGALWTISTEIQFYILLALFLNVMKKWSLKVWSSLIAVLAVISWVLGQFEEQIPSMVNKLLSVSVLPFLYIFLFGVMCYEFRDKLIPAFKKIRIPACIIYVIWSVVPETLRSGVGGVRYNVLTTMMLMICVMSLGFSFGRHRVKREWSYHFYLYHMVVINFVVHNITNKAKSVGEMMILFVTTFIATLAFTWFSGYLVDNVLVKRIQAKIEG